MKNQLTLISLIIVTSLAPTLASASIDIEPFLGMGTGMNIDRVDSDNDLSGAIQLRAGVTL